MDTPSLEKLYGLIVAQRVYREGVCPTDLNLVRLATGALSAMEQPQLERHLAECADCRRLADRLQAAGAWFVENGARVFDGLLDKAAKADLQPWAACPGREVLDRYAGGAIPHTSAGMAFSRHLEAHLAECGICRQQVETRRSSIADTIIIRIEEMRRSVADKLAGYVRELVGELQLVAVARGDGGLVRAMPGYRSASGTSASALLLDSAGQMVFDEQGHPRRIPFSVIQATLEQDGHLVLDLTTDECSVWETPHQLYLTGLALCHENRKLVFPPEKIDAQGRVIIVGTLTAGIEIRSLPLSAVELTVIAADEVSQQRPVT